MEDKLRTFIYVGSGDWEHPSGGLVTVFELNRKSFKLTFVSQHLAGGLASFLAIDQARRRLFAADEAGGGVLSFSIDEAAGSLRSLGATASENAPVYLSTTPDGLHLLAANYNQGNVDVYPVGSNGKAGLSIQTESTGAQAHCIVMDTQKRVLVANKGEGTITHLNFSGGALSAASSGPTTLESARHLIHAPDGRLYVVSEEADLITAFDVGAEGALTEAWARPRLPAGSDANRDTGGDIQVTPNGKFLYATNRGESNSVVAYNIEGGTPTLLGHKSTEGTTPRNLAIDPLGSFVIVANHGSTTSLSTFAIAEDGRLELAEVLSTKMAPHFVGVARF